MNRYDARSIHTASPQPLPSYLDETAIHLPLLDQMDYFKVHHQFNLSVLSIRFAQFDLFARFTHFGIYFLLRC
jgi:hypothetical protein